MKKSNHPRTKYSDDKAIRAWILKALDIPNKDIMRDLSIDQSTIYKWIDRVNADESLKQRAMDEKAKLGDGPFVIESYLGQSKELSESNSKTKSQQLTEWLKKNPKGNKKQFMKDARIHISDSQYYTIRKEVLGPGRNTQKKSNGKSSKNIEVESPKILGISVNEKSSEMTKLREENEFLRWQLLGERNGWVDKLLNEL